MDAVCADTFSTFARIIAKSASLGRSAANKSKIIHLESVNERVKQANWGFCLHIHLANRLELLDNYMNGGEIGWKSNVIIRITIFFT